MTSHNMAVMGVSRVERQFSGKAETEQMAPKCIKQACQCWRNGASVSQLSLPAGRALSSHYKYHGIEVIATGLIQERKTSAPEPSQHGSQKASSPLPNSNSSPPTPRCQVLHNGLRSLLHHTPCGYTGQHGALGSGQVASNIGSIIYQWGPFMPAMYPF